ncbi:Protein ccc1 [Microbotryomycetes sp. JL201]|nr:Protein ccc1 [Microbotryomycetes sp. JL201]
MVTGWIMLTCLGVMVINATDKRKQAKFERFWYSHHLFVILFVNWQLHGMFCFIKPDRPPYCDHRQVGVFWKYWLVGGALYVGERVLRQVRSRQRTYISKVVQHPSNVVEVQIRNNCPAVSRWQWHPFTLTSAPQDDFLAVHIRCVGDWTNKFAATLGIPQSRSGVQSVLPAYPPLSVVLPRLMVDGPFGTVSEDVFNYQVSVLVGAGIGITPFASVLKAVWHNFQSATARSMIPRKVHLFWICRECKAFEWFQNLLAAIEAQDVHGLIEINTYLTGHVKLDDAVNIVAHSSGEANEDAITLLRARMHYGRPDWTSVFRKLVEAHPGKEVGVFFCGSLYTSHAEMAPPKSYASVASNTQPSSGNAPATSSSSAANAAPGASVALPRRQNQAEEAQKPVWSLQEGPDTEETVPLASKCDQHNRERTICCRELKGDDDRSLIDPDIVRDIIIGLSDGLTVPFGLTAGLSSLGSSRLVYVAGIAELISGALSMGVGGYLSAQAERDHYRYLKKTTRERVQRSCAGEMEREVNAILSPLGLDDALTRRVAGALLKIEATLPPPPPHPSIFRKCLNAVARRPKFSSYGAQDEERASLLRHAARVNGQAEAATANGNGNAAIKINGKANEDDDDEAEDERGLTNFLLKFGEGLEETTDTRLFVSAITIGVAYFLGGLVPLVPYFFIERAHQALWWSCGITAVVLLTFGAFKTYYTGAEIGVRGLTWGSLVTLLVGGAAAGASFGIVRALEGSGE